MTNIRSGSPKPQRVSLSQQAHLYLRDQIEAGRYQPGERLPSQDELAAQLSISRLTVRDALRSLEQEGVIQVKHGIGTFVSPSYGHRLESGLERLKASWGWRPVKAFRSFSMTCTSPRSRPTRTWPSCSRCPRAHC